MTKDVDVELKLVERELSAINHEEIDEPKTVDISQYEGTLSELGEAKLKLYATLLKKGGYTKNANSE